MQGCVRRARGQCEASPSPRAPNPAPGVAFRVSSQASSPSSPGSDEDPDKPFKCSGCDKRFALKQSVGRHYRKRHDPNKCLFSSDGCNFTWGGPYDYRSHLKGQHKLKNKVINRILGKTAESHCRATIAGRKPFPPPLFPLYTTD